MGGLDTLFSFGGNVNDTEARFFVMQLANQVYTLLFRDRPSDRRSKSKEAVGGPAVTEEVFQ